jgi:protein ImuA
MPPGFSQPSPKPDLQLLRERIRALESAGLARGAVLPFGVSGIDAALPGGGLPLGGLHEITGTGPDEEDGAAAAGFAAVILGRLAGKAPVLWCLSVDDLYGPGLAACGLAPERLILARLREGDVLWAMEEGLRSGALAAALGEIGAVTPKASRRLQLACESRGTTGFLLRRWRRADSAARHRDTPLATVTRWRVSAVPSLPEGAVPGLGRPRWHVELLRCRGGRTGSWTLEEIVVGKGDAPLPVALFAEAADTPSALASPILPEASSVQTGTVHGFSSRAAVPSGRKSERG